ncbi:agmatine/peptidylarginine deiminase [Pseudomonas psychrotolerans]|nr:agmatine/peptidylarginine deiminase [Pseudomonas psychrotolerans]
MTTLTTPRADGFHMPAEWADQRQIWMVWPERPDNWRLGGKPAQAAFTAVAQAIARFEPVTIGASAGQYENARARLQHPNIRVVEISNDDAWCRDTGPTFVSDGKGGVRGVDWSFNAWGGLDGGLYFPWQRDDQVAGKILAIENLPGYRTPDFVLEGGSIHVDGEGTLITTEECLLNANRNPHLDRQQIERYLSDYLAVDKVIWLPHGLYNDETNGHVDNFCCYVRPGEVLLSWCDDGNGPQLQPLPRGAGRTGARDRRPRPGLQGASHRYPGPAVLQRRRVPRRGCLPGYPATPRRRAPGGLLRQLPDRQRRHHRPDLRCPRGCRGPAHPAGLFPGARSRAGTRPRDPAGRRQYPLHHPAAADRSLSFFCGNEKARLATGFFLTWTRLRAAAGCS